MTDKKLTPQNIFLQENYTEMKYGINQDGNIKGMVRYFRADDDYDKIKKLLSISFMQFLDRERSQDKMCLSNMECSDIDSAFAQGDWEKLFSYAVKYIKWIEK